MANIISCYKWVFDEEDIRINPADLSVDCSKAKSKISEYDRNAIAVAVTTGEQRGDQVISLTFGNAGVKQSLKDVLSRGPAEAFWISDALAEKADGWVTANVLAAAIEKIGDYSLIVCGEGAADTYAHQIGPRLGALLNIPVISCVAGIELDGNKITAIRKLEDYRETVKATLPVVITVLPEIMEAPIPGLKAVMVAGKKPNTELKITDLGLTENELRPCIKPIDMRGYANNRKNIVISDGNAAAKVTELIGHLKKEGVL
ncbi:MAG TPA: electron transfer flavoprotein beta subunit/FixA family protein [Syntrophomonas sp.]|nr:electron transfer flavoprotein beta subunit/FixA family protein [Syntrophomonas sp.]HRW12903.1 electron transfer flavoprotein beta subunit/FixA family protein [Syntrophomonas sp.]